MCSECHLEIISQESIHPLSKGYDIQWLDDEDNLHCLDGPAVIRSNGAQFYFMHGMIHRIGAPVRIWPDGTLEYWENGTYIRSERV